MQTMTTQRPTMPQLETDCEHTTFPPLSSARHEGCVWVSGFDFGRGTENLTGLLALVSADAQEV